MKQPADQIGQQRAGVAGRSTPTRSGRWRRYEAHLQPLLAALERMPLGRFFIAVQRLAIRTRRAERGSQDEAIARKGGVHRPD